MDFSFVFPSRRGVLPETTEILQPYFRLCLLQPHSVPKAICFPSPAAQFHGIQELEMLSTGCNGELGPFS